MTAESTPRRFSKSFLIGLALFFVTLALYWPVTRFGFLIFDDDQYVTENSWVMKGLSVAGINWALTATYAGNWHPLTWMSHMADASIYGPFAGGHHATNALLHALNTLLVFLVFKRLTRQVWASALVAALFGWHPLHVESVAWVAERKDVLSTLFFLLTLWAYANFAQKAESRKQKAEMDGSEPSSIFHSLSSSRYWLTMLCFALGLMSKPMLVTLPFVLLLLDYWPLNRFQLSTFNFQLSAIPSLVLEKLPFFALSAATCVVTVHAQHAGMAIRSLEMVSIPVRVGNALLAYAGYLVNTLWPVNLCVLYPLPAKLPVAAVVLSALALLSVSYLVFRRRASAPWAVVGWLWYLGTLLPVIGLVQVGNQAMADRYTYIPSIGLLLMAVWGMNEFQRRWPATWTLLFGGVGVALVCCLIGTRRQLAHWHDSVSVFARAVAVTENNAVAHNNLGVALANAGRSREAIDHYAAALQLKPRYTSAEYNLGIELVAVDEPAQAETHFLKALALDPDDHLLHNNLGVVLAQQGKYEPALGHFQRAIQLEPDYPKSYYNLAMALEKLGQPGAAVTNYSVALQKARVQDQKELIADIEARLQSSPATNNIR